MEELLSYFTKEQLMSLYKKLEKEKVITDLFFRIITFLSENNITYDQAIQLTKNLNDHFKQQKESVEYETCEDYYANKKCCDASNMVVKSCEDILEYFHLEKIH